MAPQRRYKSTKLVPSAFGPRRLVLPAILIVGLLGAAFVRASVTHDKMDAPLVKFTWTAPTTGSPVAHYLAEVEVNERDVLVFGPLNLAEVTVPVAYGNKYRVRVAAVDAQGIQGPMSVWSEPYSPELDPPVFTP